jgi:hypothetical protein
MAIADLTNNRGEIRLPSVTRVVGSVVALWVRTEWIRIS